LLLRRVMLKKRCKRSKKSDLRTFPGSASHEEQ
jgi:hypothetical protein